MILPGFVNAHTHLEYAVYAGFGDGLSFAPWIGDPRRAQGADRSRGDGGDRAAGRAECLRSGITTVGDCSFSGAAATACADARPAGDRLSSRCSADATAIGERFEANRERVAAALSERVRLGISPHAPYTCALELYRACAELGLPLATHLSESEAEARVPRPAAAPWASFADCSSSRSGASGIRALAEAGVLGPGVLAAHCVQADDDEIALLASTTSPWRIAHARTRLLGCGVAPLAELREAGLRVCIATDSPASTPSFDMFEELRAAVFAARARERRPDALSAAEALELATLGGARALGLDDELGSLVPGKQADLAVLSLAGSPFLPWEEPVTAAVLGGSPERVVATLVSGEPRYEKGGKTWRELTDAARNARDRLLQAADQRRSGRGHHVLPAAAPSREVDVRLPRARLRARLRPLRRRRRRHGPRRRLPRRRRRRRALGLRRRGARSREPEGRRRRAASSRRRCRPTATPTKRSRRSRATST